jgi:hypothetical protein
MRHGKHKEGVFKAAVAALQLDLKTAEESAARTRTLIEQLSARAGIELASEPEKPPKLKRRRRRKRSESRPVISKGRRKAPKRSERRTADKVVTVAAPEIIPAPAAAAFAAYRGSPMRHIAPDR